MGCLVSCVMFKALQSMATESVLCSTCFEEVHLFQCDGCIRD